MDDLSTVSPVSTVFGDVGNFCKPIQSRDRATGFGEPPLDVCYIGDRPVRCAYHGGSHYHLPMHYQGFGSAKQNRKQGTCGGLGCKLFGCPPPTEEGMGALWASSPIHARFCYIANHPVLAVPYAIGAGLLLYMVAKK